MSSAEFTEWIAFLAVEKAASQGPDESEPKMDPRFK